MQWSRMIISRLIKWQTACICMLVPLLKKVANNCIVFIVVLVMMFSSSSFWDHSHYLDKQKVHIIRLLLILSVSCFEMIDCFIAGYGRCNWWGISHIYDHSFLIKSNGQCTPRSCRYSWRTSWTKPTIPGKSLLYILIQDLGVILNKAKFNLVIQVWNKVSLQHDNL